MPPSRNMKPPNWNPISHDTMIPKSRRFSRVDRKAATVSTCKSIKPSTIWTLTHSALIWKRKSWLSNWTTGRSCANWTKAAAICSSSWITSTRTPTITSWSKRTKKMRGDRMRQSSRRERLRPTRIQMQARWSRTRRMAWRMRLWTRYMFLFKRRKLKWVIWIAHYSNIWMKFVFWLRRREIWFGHLELIWTKLMLSQRSNWWNS